MSAFSRLATGFAAAACVLTASAGVLFVCGARINTTPSIPVGLYWRTSQAPNLGAYIMFCPPVNDEFRRVRERGYVGAGSCPGRHGYFMKKVLAAKKDRMTVRPDGVWVNGLLLPNSAPLTADKGGRPLLPFKAIDRVLGQDEFLPMSDGHPLSFDGRYLGPITTSQITAVIVPILTW